MFGLERTLGARLVTYAGDLVREIMGKLKLTVNEKKTRRKGNFSGRARMAQAPPFIFLSHSGADTEAARELKRLLLASPDAKKAGLKVWFDKDDLTPGTPWSAQLAHAIQSEATAFLVYVGSSGVMNWVDAEVELAVSRTTTGKPKPLLFIPVLAAEGRGADALPPFAKRYQGVHDPLGNSDELAKLLKAVLDLDSKTTPILIDEPFVGLRAMREEEADRFFGRKAEIAALVEKFGKHRVVAIVADSGTGKSSLARAGFAPAFRGGALIDPAGEALCLRPQPMPSPLGQGRGDAGGPRRTRADRRAANRQPSGPSRRDGGRAGRDPGAAIDEPARGRGRRLSRP